MREPDEDIIRDMEKSIEEGRELAGAHRVSGRVSQNLSVTFALRLSRDEHDEFARAAESRGMTLADLMRSATRAAVEGQLDAEKAAALNKARAAARELAATLEAIV
ncbi:MAG TPA: hypothetical protein VFY10_06180 [Dehalococcoidia bacterium]|nr:hypothetical protein [Dehalococcoidia bacterium]